MDEDIIVPVMGMLSVFVFFPLAIAMARFIWKRAGEPARPAIDSTAHMKLEQLQQAVDAIAIEVERISENQRFVTKALAEKSRID
jgi:hypothetical protein